MKNFSILFLALMELLGMYSCSQDECEILYGDNYSKIETRALKDDLVSVITPLVVDSDLIAMPQTRIVPAYYDVSDPFFSSNLYAIREIPVTIQARRNGKYLTYNGAGKEVTLSNTNRMSTFYFKILPASSGIPYLIYSSSSNTPLSVGQYNNNPTNKILYVRTNNSEPLMSAAWDLIPSSSYKGYFAIQSQSYLGQSVPNNMWSVFNYVLETKSNEKLGYGQYTKQSSQEFLITPLRKFRLRYLEFHKEGTIVNKQSPLKVTTYSQNTSEEKRPFTIQAVHYACDESRFCESSLLKVSIYNLTDKFYRPNVVGEHIVPPLAVKPEDDPAPIRPEADMVYSTTNQKIPVKLEFNINGFARPNSLIEVTSYLKNYSVSAKYTAYLTYIYKNEERLVKINGTWYGKIYTTERDNKYPKDIIKYFDLDDGEELLRSKSIQLSPITLNK